MSKSIKELAERFYEIVSDYGNKGDLSEVLSKL